MTAPAKPKMRDGLIKRGGMWYFALDEPRDPATGKRRQKWVPAGRTREEARRARNDARARKDRGGWKAPTRTILGQYLTGTWLPSIRAKVAPSTFTSYRQNLGHVAERLGHVRLTDLDPPTLDALYADLEAGGLARSTVRLIHTQLHRALADAVAWELLVRNPSDLVDPPKPARRVRVTWTADQLRAFLAGVAADRLAALYQLAAASGMRLGELVGLGWADMHLDGGYLTVRQAKTAAGRRRVELDPATIAALRAHRRAQAAERLAFGAGYADHGRVFTRPGGEPLNPDAVSIQFKRRAARLGLPPIRFHDLRHGWATMALEAGEHPKVVAEQLGHASVRVTLDTYSHVTPGTQRAAVSRVAGLFLPAVSSVLANEPASGSGEQGAGS
ncbi:MAG TPA: tyrosine-type recombinase/integrase [Actinomycetes bacterium]|nr:tyrosine-type recombinase/integrase [Actinomycetes bacterium]